VEPYHGEAVTIPSRYIGAIEQKRVQVARSLLIAGAILGGRDLDRDAGPW